MRVLEVVCERNDSMCRMMVYQIHENRIGQLVWYQTSDPRTVPAFTIKCKRWGNMVGTLVTPEEAEAITGLHSPVAMDRLRELVHESPTVIEA